MTVLLAAMAAPPAAAIGCGKANVEVHVQSTQNDHDVCAQAVGVAYFVAGTAIDTAYFVLETVEESDDDEDGVPDLAEQAICGTGILHDAVNTPPDLVGVRCVSETDLTIPNDLINDVVEPVKRFVWERVDEANETAIWAIGFVTNTTFWAIGFAWDTAWWAVGFANETVEGLIEEIHRQRDQVDPDHDNVPQALEPTLCKEVENPNFEYEGDCDADDRDYRPYAPV